MRRHYYEKNAWIVLPTGSRVKLSNPETNEFVSGWKGDKTVYNLVEKRTAKGKGYILVAGSGTKGYGQPDNRYNLYHDQTQNFIANVKYIGASVDPKRLIKFIGDKSVPLYVFK